MPQRGKGAAIKMLQNKMIAQTAATTVVPPSSHMWQGVPESCVKRLSDACEAEGKFQARLRPPACCLSCSDCRNSVVPRGSRCACASSTYRWRPNTSTALLCGTYSPATAYQLPWWLWSANFTMLCDRTCDWMTASSRSGFMSSNSSARVVCFHYCR